MGMGVSLLLIAVGAVLVWAVNATVQRHRDPHHRVDPPRRRRHRRALRFFSLIFLVELGRSRRSPQTGRRRTVVRRRLLDEHRHPPCLERAPASAGLLSFQGMPMRVEAASRSETPLPMMFLCAARAPQDAGVAGRPRAVVTLHQVHPGRNAPHLSGRRGCRAVSSCPGRRRAGRMYGSGRRRPLM